MDEQRRSGVGRRRGVAEISGKRCPVTDLNRPHDAGRLNQGWKVPLHSIVLDDVRHRRERADAEMSVNFGNLWTQLTHPLEIHDDFGRDVFQAQANQHVGAPGEQPGIRTGRVENRPQGRQ